MALNVALPSPLASRLGENASLVTESTRKSGFASSVQVHWLWVELPRSWETRATLPGRYWLIAAELTTPQALGTEWNSPGWNVVTSPLSLEFGAGLLWNGSFPRTPSTTATPTTTTRPAMMISRRVFLALAAAHLPLHWAPSLRRRPAARSGCWARTRAAPMRCAPTLLGRPGRHRPRQGAADAPGRRGLSDRCPAPPRAADHRRPGHRRRRGTADRAARRDRAFPGRPI